MPERVRRAVSLLGRGIRNALYPLVALPVGLYALGLAVVGRSGRAVDAETGLVRRLLPSSTDPESDAGRDARPNAGPNAGPAVVTGPEPSRAVASGLVRLPVSIVAFALACYLWAIPVLNLGYPLRPDVTTESLRHGTWGGPTLAGAWSVHAVGAVLFFVLIGLPILSATARLQARLLRGLFGAAPGSRG